MKNNIMNLNDKNILNIKNDLKNYNFIINSINKKDIINNNEFINDRIELIIKKANNLLKELEDKFIQDINNSKLADLLEYQDKIRFLNNDLKNIILSITYFYGAKAAQSIEYLNNLILKFRLLKSTIKKFSNEVIENEVE